MKSRALDEARWILRILAAGCLVSLVLFPPALILVTGLLVFSLYFFRDPERRPPSDEALAVSPADGVVVEVNEVDETEFLSARAKRIGIFLSVFDVHVNRAPIAGEITHTEAKTGRFFDARNPSSAQHNARRTWIIRGNGMTIVVRQITGAVARRICAWKQAGERVDRGERFGMIRFGSRTEVDLPIESEILVQLGDRVRGGETAIARVKVGQE